jgi:peroxiredoxin
MSRLSSFVAVVAGCLCLVAVTPRSLSAVAQAAEEKATSPIGRKAENFTLNDFYGKAHALADYQDKKIVVLAFLGTECPLAKLYAPRLAAMQQKLADKGVQFLGVDSNRQDSITEIASYARVHDIKFPILKDLNNKLADQLGAMRTPEIFVLDQNRMIRYRGIVDDQYGIGFAKKEVSETYLQSAIDQLLSGAAVAKSETEVAGCYIGRIRKTDSTAKVTYSNQVARILNKNCVSCHRPGEIAPFAMTNYDEVSGWADMIAEVVRQQRMPPWHADPKYGHFSNDRSLPAEEK